jgi:FkbM family methyltransferase
MKLSTYRHPSAFTSDGRPLPMKDYILYKCLGSFKAFVRANDYVIGGHLAFDGFWEPHVTMAFIDLLDAPGWPANPTFCDLGANSGYYSMIASHLGFRATAIEADPENVKLLRMNAKMCGRSFHVIQGVVGSKGLRADVIVDPISSNSSFVLSPAGSIPAVKVPEADVYKIDLEGGDEAVIQEIMARLTQPKQIFFEYAPHRYAQSPNYILDHFMVYETRSRVRIHTLPLQETDLILQPK